MLRRRAAVVAGIGLVLLIGLAGGMFAAHDAVASFAVRSAVRALGYDLRAQRITVGTGALVAIAPDVRNARGEPVLAADRLEIAFALRDLLPGSHARFGLRAVDLQRPRLTLIHHADGTYNIALPGASGPPARPDATPFDVRLRVRDGTILLVDRFIDPRHERVESLRGVAADGILSPNDPSYYRVDAALEDGARRYPIAGRGRFDHRRRFASQHWYAADLPIGPLVDFAIGTHAVNLVDGRLRGVDARVYGFIDDTGTTRSSVSAIARLSNGKLFASALRVPIGDMRGTLLVHDGGLDTPGADATLAGVPLHLVGGIYDLANPTLRFTVAAAGSLRALRTISDASAHRPLDGDVAALLRIDGPLAQPVVRAQFGSHRIAYDRYALHDAAGTFVLRGENFAIDAASAHYGPLALRATGTLLLRKDVTTDLFVAIDGPSTAIPYAQALVARAAVHASVHLRGVGPRLAGDGLVRARGDRAALDAPFTLDPGGNGTVGPVYLERSDGARVYARARFDRAHGTIDGVIRAQRLALLSAPPVRLPGFSPAALPALRGSIDADLAGSVHGARIVAAAGTLRVRRAGYAGVALGDADLTGSYGGGTGAARGNVRTDLARSVRLVRGVRGEGVVDAPIRIVGDGARTIVQIAGARFTRARLDGIPLRGAFATLALRGHALDVRALRIDAAGGHVVASGSVGNGGTIGVTAGGIDADAFRAFGVPVTGGRLAAAATIGGTSADPRAVLGAAVAGGRYAGAPVSATVQGSYAHGDAAIGDARLTYADAVLAASGTVRGLTAPRPRIDVDARVRDADIATAAHRFRLPLRSPEGNADADVRVRGDAFAPDIAGDARIAAGSLNGLAFRDVEIPLRGNARGIAVQGGRATVGSTTLRFGGAVSAGGAVRAALHSDRADLADFNDYFDAADTLAGRGRVALRFDAGSSSLATDGDVAIAGARYRRLPIGDVAAAWSSRGRAIGGRARIGGPHGVLVARGTALLPASAPLAHVAQSTLGANASVAALDLSTWLPAAGVIVPVTGFVDGNAHVRGVVSRLAIDGQASVRRATAGRVPIDRLSVAVATQGSRIVLRDAQLAALNLHAHAQGNFGRAPGDPIALRVDATSPDIVAFVDRATGATYDGSGALTTTATLGGTLRAPLLRDVLDLDAPRYGTMRERHAHADVAYAAGRLTVRELSADLAAGRIALAGAIPATTNAPYLNRNGPLTARVRAEGVDIGQFAGLFPAGTKAGGVVNADVQASGTLADPQFAGTAGLARGSYVSPLSASKISGGTLQLAFAGRRATLTRLHADVGGGAIDGDGSASIGDLRDPRSLAFTLRTHEQHIGLDLPRYLRGKLDGDLTVARAAGAAVQVGGSLAFSRSRIPLAAIIPSAPSRAPAAAPPPIAFDLNVAATSDDRVQGPAVDIGATGAVHLGGTLARPQLAGTMRSTGGTISFYRTFVLQDAAVAFDPAAGIIPDVDVTATSHVPDPATDVLLHAHGRATSLALDFASRPEYDKAQIVGLLVGAQNLGAVNGVARGASPQGGANPISGAALGYIDAQFTQGLFEPFSSTLGRSLGFSSLNLNAGLTGGFSASATRALGDKLQSTFSESDGTQRRRESFGLALNLNDATSFGLTLFNAGTQSRTIGTSSPIAPDGPVNLTLESLSPPAGSSGYVFSYVHRFP